MKGNNTIQINEATMIDAMQYWLNREMTSPPKVTGVSLASIGYSKVFDIEVGEAEDAS